MASVVGAVALVVIYFTVPLSRAELGLGMPLVWSVVALAVLAAVVVRVIARGANLVRLLTLVLVVVVVLSLGFYGLALRPGEFVGLETRIDALYFTLTTMTTTGYGDIHAAGQASRLLVAATFAFDLIFLALLTAEVSRIARARRTDTTHRPPTSMSGKDKP